MTPKACPRPLCPGYVIEGKCDTCEYDANAKRKRTGWQSDNERGTRQERGYDQAWLDLRARKLAHDPLCELQLEGCRDFAEEVHHVVSFHGLHDPLRLDWDNLQSACKWCHGKVTRERSHGVTRTTT